MNTHDTYTLAMWPSVLTIGLLTGLAAYGWGRRVPGARPFAVSCILAVPLAVSHLMTSLAIDAESRVFWYSFSDPWWVPAASAMTCFILEYANPGRWLTRRNLMFLSVVPVAGLLFVLVRGLSAAPAVPRIGHFGLMGAVQFFYSFVLLFINLAVFVWLFVRSPRHRWPVILMATGDLTGRILIWASSPELDARLLHFPVVAFPYLAYSVALFGFRIFDPLPMARQMAIERLPVGMLVLDSQECVVSLNSFAERMLNCRTAQVKGRRVRELLPAYGEGAESFADETEIEFSLGSGQELRHYTLSVSKIDDFRGLDVGRLLLVRDVTGAKQAQAELVEQQRVLAAFKEREQLARELHDSIGQVLGYGAFQVDAAVTLIRNDNADAAVSQLGRLNGVLRDSHADVREYILNLRHGLFPQQPFVEVLEQYLLGFTSNHEMATRLDVTEDGAVSEIPADTRMHLLRIVQEALSNARRHGHARSARVALTANRAEPIRLTIEDDGVGFDPATPIAREPGHFGLPFMRERAEALGGRLQIESSPGTGTRLYVEIPRKEC